MPVIGDGKDKLIDSRMLFAWIVARRPRLIVIEKVGARPGQGVVSMFNFGVAFGTVLGLSTATASRVYMIAPARWQRVYGLIGRDKSASIKEAYLRFPSLRGALTRKKDDGRAEALLIADYGVHHAL